MAPFSLAMLVYQRVVTTLGDTVELHSSSPSGPTFQKDLRLLRLGATEASRHSSRLVGDLLHIGADEDHGILLHLAKFTRFTRSIRE